MNGKGKKVSEEMKKEALEFARANPTSNLATVEGDQPHVRVMATTRTDDDFTVWYATHASSNKVRQIRACPKVCVTFWAGAADLRIFGKAEIVEDKDAKDTMWNEEWLQFWPKGKEDPEYTLIKVTPEKVEFRNMEKYGMMPTVL
jgi:general stress protein 26